MNIMRNLKPSKISFFVLIFLANNFISFAAPKTKVLVPKNANSSISIIVSGKSYKYYPLSAEESLILTTKGPGKLKIITRGHLNSQSGSSSGAMG